MNHMLKGIMSFISKKDKGCDEEEQYFTRYDKDNPNISDYMATRLESRIKWYNCKAKSNMMRFNGLQIVTFGLSSLIPIVNVIDGLDMVTRIISALFGGFIAAITGILQLTKAQESWILYRSTAETLIKEYNLFMLKSGDYSENSLKEERQRNRLFVERCESIMSTEGSKYFSLRQQQTSHAPSSSETDVK